jgi:Flp pilus assembly pilin Flp
VGLVEYALILVLLAIVLLSVLSLLGGRAQNVFQSIVRDVVG